MNGPMTSTSERLAPPSAEVGGSRGACSSSVLHRAHVDRRHEWAPRSACDTWPDSSAKLGSNRSSGARGIAERHLEVADDPPGPAGHHEHPGGEEHRLGDRVGDEQRRRSRSDANSASSSSLSRSRVISSSAPNGSSNRNTFGLERQRPGQRGAHLHAARQLLGVLVLEAGQPDEVDRLLGEPCAARPWPTPCSSASSSTLRRTVRHGSSVGVLEDVAEAVAVRPERRRSWSVSRPDAIRSSVDLPQPDGPTMVTNSPGRTSNETSTSATVPSGKALETLSKTREASALGRVRSASGARVSTPGTLGRADVGTASVM